MAHRGRKRLQGRKRQPNGQPRREKDSGTPELQQRREWYGNGDPTLTSYPLGVMYANGIIGPEQQRAGLYYAWLHGVVEQKGMAAAQRFERVPKGHERNSEDPAYVAWRRKQKARYLAGREAVEDVGLRGAEFVNTTILSEVMPRFLQPQRRTYTDLWECQVINEALTNLAKCYGQIKVEPFDKHTKTA